MSRLNLYFDGAARPNPGPAACAAVLIEENGQTVAHVGHALGSATNNVAEWTALELGLIKASELGATHVNVLGDSQLVINQAFGTWNIGEEHLRTIASRVKALVGKFHRADGTHIAAGKNAAADTICNAVLDNEYVPFDAPCLGMMSNLAFVTHVFVDAQRFADGASRNKLRLQIENIVRDALPVADIAVKRTAAHKVPIENGLADLPFAIRLKLTAAAGAPDQREAIRTRILERISRFFPNAVVTRVSA